MSEKAGEFIPDFLPGFFLHIRPVPAVRAPSVQGFIEELEQRVRSGFRFRLFEEIKLQQNFHICRAAFRVSQKSPKIRTAQLPFHRVPHMGAKILLGKIRVFVREQERPAEFGLRERDTSHIQADEVFGTIDFAVIVSGIVPEDDAALQQGFVQSLQFFLVFPITELEKGLADLAQIIFIHNGIRALIKNHLSDTD